MSEGFSSDRDTEHGSSVNDYSPKLRNSDVLSHCLSLSSLPGEKYTELRSLLRLILFRFGPHEVAAATAQVHHRN